MVMNETLRAISDPVRRDKSGKKSAREIVEQFELTGVTVSYHLAKLKNADLISEQKYKNFIYFELKIVLQISTLRFSLGWNIDIRRISGVLVGIKLIAIGNYLPKLDYVKNYDIDTEKARKINRFIGVETVIMGALILISLLMPPIATTIALVMLIPYSILAVIYEIFVGRSK